MKEKRGEKREGEGRLGKKSGKGGKRGGKGGGKGRRRGRDYKCPREGKKKNSEKRVKGFWKS